MRSPSHTVVVGAADDVASATANVLDAMVTGTPEATGNDVDTVLEGSPDFDMADLERYNLADR